MKALLIFALIIPLFAQSQIKPKQFRIVATITVDSVDLEKAATIERVLKQFYPNTDIRVEELSKPIRPSIIQFDSLGITPWYRWKNPIPLEYNIYPASFDDSFPPPTQTEMTQ